MTRTRVGINGFGRMGRLALRAGWGSEEIEFVQINELQGDAETAAHLLYFDSVHGRWDREVSATDDAVEIEGERIGFSNFAEPGEVPWDVYGVDVVIESSGRFRTIEKLEPYFSRGVRKVVVAAPVKDERALNVVVGVNDDRYDPDVFDIVTAASCTRS